MDILLNLDHSLQFHGLSVRLSQGCPMFQLDRLLFPQMDHTARFHEDNSPLSACHGVNPTSEPSVQDRVLTIHSSLRDSSSLSLGRFISLLQEPDTPAMTTVFSAAGGIGYKARMHSAITSVLGAMIASPVEIGDGILSLEAETDIYGTYGATLRVSAPTNTPWDRLVLNTQGELGEESQTDIENSVHTYLQRNVIERALTRRRNVEMAVNRSEVQVAMLEARLAMRETRLLQANQSYTLALEQLQNATSDLTAAQGAFEDANDEVNAARNALNNVCTEDDCPDVEGEEVRCSTCYTNSYASNSYLCPSREPVLVCGRVRQRPDRMMCRQVFYNYCSSRCWRICAFFYSWTYCSGRVCRGKATNVCQKVPRFRLQCRLTTRTRWINCPGLTVTGRTPSTCCDTVRALVEDTQCKEDCRNFRDLAVQGLQESRQELAAPFQVLESARAAQASAQGALSRETLRRNSARDMRDQLLPPLESARAARDLNIQNQERVFSSVENDLRLMEQVTGQQGGQDTVFEILGASFNVSIDSISPTRIPVTIRYESMALQRTGSVVVVFDFLSPQQINLERVTVAIVQDLLNTTSLPVVKRSATRFKKQAEVEELEGETTPNEVQFQENCAAISALEAFASDLSQGLHVIRERNGESRARLEASISDLRNKEKSNANIDFEILRGFFNMSLDNSVRENFDQGSSEYRAYVAEQIRAASDSIEEIDSMSFSMWQATTELLYDELGSVVGYPCSGFADCLEVVGNLAVQLATDLPASEERDRLVDSLQRSASDLLSLATSMDLTLTDAIDTTTTLQLLLRMELISNYWCSSLPNITSHPPFTVDVEIRTDLILNCSAESSLPAVVHWRRNGVPIPNADGYTLLIQNTQMLDSANYTCVVTNAVGSSESPITNVTVYELPEFFSVLEPVTTVIGNESGAWFACNASGFPYPGWRWYYRSQPSDPWREIQDEDTNELTIQSPQLSAQGWYTCEAYSPFGSTRAEAVYLTILPRSVSQLSLGVRLKLVVEASEEDTTDSTEDIFSGDAEKEGIDGGVRCSSAELSNVISSYLSNEVGLGEASIAALRVTFNPNVTEFSVSFVLMSLKVRERRMGKESSVSLENRALPSRGDIMRAKVALQRMASSEGDTISFTCNSSKLMLKKNSLNFGMWTYLCQEGQELNSNFLFCGKLNNAKASVVEPHLLSQMAKQIVHCPPPLCTKGKAILTSLLQATGPELFGITVGPSITNTSVK